MESMWDTCINYMKTDDAKRQLRESVIEPIGDILYNEMYFYVWFICLYHVFLILIILNQIIFIRGIFTLLFILFFLYIKKELDFKKMFCYFINIAHTLNNSLLKNLNFTFTLFMLWV